MILVVADTSPLRYLVEIGCESLLPRLFDLHAVVKANCYHPKFHGSFSIKEVLPAMVPELSYEGREIADGMAAVRAYYRLVGGRLSASAHRALAKELRAYCELDTLAMVRVYDALGKPA